MLTNRLIPSNELNCGVVIILPCYSVNFPVGLQYCYMIRHLCTHFFKMGLGATVTELSKPYVQDTVHDYACYF